MNMLVTFYSVKVGFLLTLFLHKLPASLFSKHLRFLVALPGFQRFARCKSLAEPNRKFPPAKKVSVSLSLLTVTESSKQISLIIKSLQFRYGHFLV